MVEVESVTVILSIGGVKVLKYEEIFERLRTELTVLANVFTNIVTYYYSKKLIITFFSIEKKNVIVSETKQSLIEYCHCDPGYSGEAICLFKALPIKGLLRSLPLIPTCQDSQ